MFMIEQALAIATSDGGSSKATIQIPTSLSMDGQHMQISGQNIILDNNTGQFNIKVEQVKLPGKSVACCVVFHAILSSADFFFQN